MSVFRGRKGGCGGKMVWCRCLKKEGGYEKEAIINLMKTVFSFLFSILLFSNPDETVLGGGTS
jgi:hypothetical protein